MRGEDWMYITQIWKKAANISSNIASLAEPEKCYKKSSCALWGNIHSLIISNK